MNYHFIIMKKIFVLLFICCNCSITILAQNVGINSSGAAPANCAMLDIAATDKGLLVPRVALTAVGTYAPLTGTAVNGLLVYSTAAPTGGNGTGYYYWTGAQWANLIDNITPGTPWYLNGNTSNTTPAAPATYGTSTIGSSEHFLGTTDANDIVFGTNNIERMRVKQTTGFTGIGISAPLYPLHVVTSAISYTGRFENSGASNTAAIIGRNTAANGTGTGCGVYGYTGQSAGFGILATNINTTGTGILASGQNAVASYLPTGSGGSFSGAATGVVCNVTSATGTGIRASGQGVASYPALGIGSGGAFSGTSIGIAAFANNAGNNNWGGYFTNGNANGYAYVGGRIGGIDYKINGPGAVSTIVKNTKGEIVNMYCPEAPEILFQDFGKGKLLNGFVHIELDKDFAKNITVNDKHPLRVIVQLEGDCNGVFVTNHSATGFDVKELQGGNSNISFTYFVSANRADGEDENGFKGSKNADARFGEAPAKAEVKNTDKKDVGKELKK